MDIKFNSIYIFDVKKEEAYTMNFEEGINIITSSDIDGTDRGKSVLLRSLYHSLGADAYFDSKWNESDKIYILKFEVQDNIYSIYRSRQLFKIFDSNEKLVFRTIHRSELAIFLGELFNFAIYLPNRIKDQLIIAPPAYSFLFNFLDQDKYDGTSFESFKNLRQFSNFKLNVIYSHLGIYNKNYFELIKQKEEFDLKIKSKKDEIDELNKMKDRTNLILDGFSCPETTEALENELSLETKEYSRLINEMNIIRNKLVDLRNQLEEQNIILKQLSKTETKKEKELKKILKDKVCPECHSILNDTLELRSKRYNYVDNIFNLRDEIKIENINVQEEISKNEKIYSDLVLALDKHNEKICKNKKEIDDYTRFKGLNKFIDEINSDLIVNVEEIDTIENNLKPIKKEIKKIKDKKKNVDENYYYLIDKLKNKFKLNELEAENYENLSKNFCASGSNKPLSTVIWYLTLNELKNKFCPEGTRFPMVFDSPNNAEMDQEKKHALIQYIIDSSNNFKQIIISAIGFNVNEYNINSKINIKILDNKKYCLLNKEVYKKNYRVLECMNEA
ncbi:hypothetical protein MU1CBH_12520 [Megamonas funiformis]|uniref:hypothetical protein n=1 Tax=Megamonas funiformis TaxID=437897 RepID=UPI001CC425ED|nr:hypothetical protein [Megamonas funiformis]BDA10224.1 hypothetical protein MU1CBH_12520 [Megamonas funiformis]